MVSNTELNSNYIALSQLPIVKRTLKCVKRLTNENKELKKENEMLKKMIDTLFDRQTKGNSKCCCRRHKSTQSPLPEVHIKKEKNIIDISNEPENITYELRDTCNTTDKPFTYGDETNDMAENIKIMDIKELNVEESEEEVEVEESEEEEEEEDEGDGARFGDIINNDDEEEEEEVEIEVEESEEEEEVDVEEEVEVEVEEEEEEVYEVTIKNKSYYATNETDGPIYAIIEDEDIGDQVGEFKKGKPTFYKKTNK